MDFWPKFLHNVEQSLALLSHPFALRYCNLFQNAIATNEGWVGNFHSKLVAITMPLKGLETEGLIILYYYISTIS